MQVQRDFSFFPSSMQQNKAGDIIRNIIAQEGFKGFFRGFGGYLLVYGPSSAIWWSVYEASKGSLLKIGLRQKSEHVNSDRIIKYGNFFVSGAIAGIAATTATNPLDVTRTRQQLLDLRSKRDRELLKRGFWGLFKSIYRNEGVIGLYRGLRPRVLISAPGSALTFMGYEIIKEYSIKKG